MQKRSLCLNISKLRIMNKYFKSVNPFIIYYINKTIKLP